MSSEKQQAPVKLKADTIARLKRHGEFGETYDQLVNKILDKAEAGGK